MIEQPFNSSDDEQRCRDIRETDDHAVFDHAFRSHDDCRSYRREAERHGLAESLLQLLTSEEGISKQQRANDVGSELRPKGAQFGKSELVVTSKAIDEERTRGDDHVKINHDVASHAVVNHEAR